MPVFLNVEGVPITPPTLSGTHLCWVVVCYGHAHWAVMGNLSFNPFPRLPGAPWGPIAVS